MNPSAIFLRDMKPAPQASRPQAQARPSFSLGANDGDTSAPKHAAAPDRTGRRDDRMAAQTRAAAQDRRDAQDTLGEAREAARDAAKDTRANGRGRPEAPASRRSARADEVSNRDKTKFADGKPPGDETTGTQDTGETDGVARTTSAMSAEEQALAALATAQAPDESAIAQVKVAAGETTEDTTSAEQGVATQIADLQAKLPEEVIALPGSPLTASTPATDASGEATQVGVAAAGAETTGQAKPATTSQPGLAATIGAGDGLPDAGTEDAVLADAKALGDDLPAGKESEAKEAKDTQKAAARVAQPGEAKPDLASAAQSVAQRLEALPPGLTSLPDHARALQAHGIDGKPGLGAQQAQANQREPSPISPPTSLAALPIEIGFRALSGTKRFDIRLDPPELGRVDVSLSFDKEGEVTAKLTVERVETLHLLQRDARTLERAFDQAGLRTSDAGIQMSLSDRSAGQGGGFQAEEQRARSNQGRDETDARPQIADLMPPPRRMRLGGVDLNV